MVMARARWQTIRSQWADAWQKQRRHAPPPEDSGRLRLLAQLLVSVGVVAADWSAETQLSLWAIPLGLIGALWSWRNRYRRNIPIKFLLAIGMILALAAFFVRLITERQLNDTRLLLLELLVQVQVLHSFDLPRRKDLGYSMVIALILLGVASTLSQTIAFGGLLLVFLAIALPVLVLDYRSRLGLHATQPNGIAPTRRTAIEPRSRQSHWMGLPKLFGLTVLLGLALFAVMPRFQGYQLRSFPMSAPIAMPKQFNPAQIANSAYARAGKAPGQGTVGQSPQTGSGEADENVYSGFGEKINQNLRGQLKPRLVLRVRSQAPGFWRVQAFDRYTGQGWEMSRNRKTTVIERDYWGYKFNLIMPLVGSRKQEVVQTYTLATDFVNLIPALSAAKDLYFPTTQVAVDPDGTLRSPLPLTEGLTYTVVSDVPYRDRVQLQQARSEFTQLRYPTTASNPYLQVPEKILDRVRQRTLELLATSPTPITADYEKALYLGQALKQRYRLQEALPFFGEREDLVEAFLFKYQGGYPDHFATALTVMLRSIGISSRLVTGFGTGRWNPFTGYYEVQNTDAHGLSEVYLQNYGWWPIDPIPGHALVPPSVEQDQTFGVLQQVWKWVAGWVPSPIAAWFGNAVSRLSGALGNAIAQVLSWLGNGWVGVVGGSIGAICLAFLGFLGWQGWRDVRYRWQLRRLAPMERLYRQMLDRLAQQGIVKLPSQTPLEFACRSWAQPAQAEAIEVISQAYVQWRYGQQSVSVKSLQKAMDVLPRSGIKWPRFRSLVNLLNSAKLSLLRIFDR